MDEIFLILNNYSDWDQINMQSKMKNELRDLYIQLFKDLKLIYEERNT